MEDAVYTQGLRRLGCGRTEGDRALDEVARGAAQKYLGEDDGSRRGGDCHGGELAALADGDETSVYAEVWVLVGEGDAAEAVSEENLRTLRSRAAVRVFDHPDFPMRFDSIVVQFVDPAAKHAYLSHYVGVAEWNV